MVESAFLSGSFVHSYLLGGTPLQNIRVSWDDDSQDVEKNVPNRQPAILEVSNKMVSLMVRYIYIYIYNIYITHLSDHIKPHSG